MDPVILSALVLLALSIVFRLARTYKNSRGSSGEEIRRKLEMLRKKRDEE